MTTLYTILVIWLLINTGVVVLALWIGEMREHPERVPETMRWIAQRIAVREELK